MEPERKPSRSRVTQVKPSSRRPATRRARRSGWTRPAQGVDRDLDPGQVAVVADAELGQAEGAEQGLGPLDPGQAGRGDLDAIGDPGGQAGRGRLVGGAQAEAAGGLADLGLGQAGRHQRGEHAAGGRGPLAGPVVAQVVGVGPDGQGEALGAGQGAEHLEQLVLAEEAAVGAVAQVAGPLALVGGHHQVAGAQLGGQRRRRVQLLLGEARGDPGGRHRPLPQRLDGRGQQEGRVGPARERHHHPAGGGEVPPQGGRLGVQPFHDLTV